MKFSNNVWQEKIVFCKSKYLAIFKEKDIWLQKICTQNLHLFQLERRRSPSFPSSSKRLTGPRGTLQGAPLWLRYAIVTMKLSFGILQFRVDIWHFEVQSKYLVFEWNISITTYTLVWCMIQNAGVELLSTVVVSKYFIFESIITYTN